MNPDNQPTPEDDSVLRETLKRCSPATYYAACKFRQGGRSEDLHQVIFGIVERFVERDLRAKVRSGDDALRLREDLGLDSLTMMEVVMLAEEVLHITVANEELAHLRTLGDTRRFIESKHAERRAPASAVPLVHPTAEPWPQGALERHLRSLGPDAPFPPAA